MSKRIRKQASDRETYQAAVLLVIDGLRAAKADIFASQVAAIAYQKMDFGEQTERVKYGLIEFLKVLARKVITRKFEIGKVMNSTGQSTMFDDSLSEYVNRQHRSGEEGGYIHTDNADRETMCWNMRRDYKNGQKFIAKGDVKRDYIIAKWGPMTESDFMDRPDDDFDDDDEPDLL